MIWWQGPVQPCPLTTPNANGWVPVYAAPMPYVTGTLPPPAGWLKGTTDKLFVCQDDYADAEVQFNGSRSSWWAYTKADDGDLGYVSEVFFLGGLADEPDGGLRRCPAPAPTPTPTPVLTPGTPPPPPPAPPSGTPADSDHDGTPDSVDACPNEDARARDANLNGCLDLGRLMPEFLVDPGTYAKRIGDRYKLLGIITEHVTVTGLRTGARVTLSCTRSACPFQRKTATAGRRMEFKAMRGRKLRTGVRMTLRATRPGSVGRGARYTVRPNAMRKSTFCIRPTGREGSCSTKR